MRTQEQRGRRPPAPPVVFVLPSPNERRPATPARSYMNVCFALSDVIWSSQEPDVLLFALSNSMDELKLRLFACACARRVWPLLADERSRRAVVAAEGYADGLVSNAELERAWKEAREAALMLQAIRGRSRAPVAAARD